MVPVIHCGASSARDFRVWSKQALGETPKSRTLNSRSYSAAKAGPIIRETRIIRCWVMVVVFIGGFAMKRKGKVENVMVETQVRFSGYHCLSLLREKSPPPPSPQGGGGSFAFPLLYTTPLSGFGISLDAGFASF